METVSNTLKNTKYAPSKYRVYFVDGMFRNYVKEE